MTSILLIMEKLATLFIWNKILLFRDENKVQIGKPF